MQVINVTWYDVIAAEWPMPSSEDMQVYHRGSKAATEHYVCFHPIRVTIWTLNSLYKNIITILSIVG